ncbi:2,4-dienoyl-CoA reductase [Streptomyces sp. DSM 44917]|uniref:2,4-dienoyl-CoA reductase n=1 Tax=Streptomyces boetiae TaxID=3075541 RepID=A0ABU2LAW9_9ACTN|nr:2,4-dienoyl-CoA reductase [Streptomyces sp. DSM 44917]MDT0308428.1 2,4-dienoyl-CoA reductase [Streptomyces sp. DSM 44917]
MTDDTAPRDSAPGGGPGTGTPELSTPLALPCGVTLPNRLAKSAMSEQLGDAAHRPTPALARLYGRWGRGGAGLLITGNVMVDRRSLGEPRNVVVEDGRDLDALRAWARAARAAGAAALMQLNHPGRQTPPGLSAAVVAPSAVRVNVGGARFPLPRALTAAEIAEQTGRFAAAAAVAVEAGFDGVQVHAAHGYLVSQFLSPLANLRTDDWGGDPGRRRRFLLETVRAVRAAIGPGRVLSVKLNSADFQRGGFGEAESLEVVRALAAERVDLLEISGGTYERAAMMGQEHRGAGSRAREAYFLAFAERARAEAAAGALPLMVTGGFRSGTAMRAALASGVDVVGLGRPLALEPDLPRALLADPEATASRARPLTTGVRLLDGAAELAWHGHQLRRMGAGRPPLPRLGARRALLRGMARDGVNILRRRRGGA